MVSFVAGFQPVTWSAFAMVGREHILFKPDFHAIWKHSLDLSLSKERGWRSLQAVIAMFLCGIIGAPAVAQRVVLKPQADAIARQRGWPVRKESPTGEVIELQKIVNDIPLYYVTLNRTAADSVSSDEVWPGGSAGLSLSGSGVRLGIWDGGRVRTTHQEFGGRAVQRDGSATNNSHSTHVAGTMIGTGLSPAVTGRPAGQSHGMSHLATLDCYDFSSDTAEMSTAAAAGLLASNHSYGLITGWRFDDLGAGAGWYWLGDVNVSTFEDYFFGFYSLEAAAWDDIAYKKPYYLMIKSSGNDRNEGPTPGTTHFVMVNGNWVASSAVRSVDGNSGYDSTSHASVSKNILAVGAVNDVVGGYSSPGGVVMSSFSGWGPADDGRIKPDVVGNGVDLWSATSSTNTAYAALSGTSMSSPNVTGTMGLLIQHYRAMHGGADMRSSTLKAVVIHTADECGLATGPDYANGWGLVNTVKAAGVITLDQTEPGLIQELALVSGQTMTQAWTYSGSGPIKATIVWTDPPGVPPAPALDPPNKALVNDLDLRILGPGSTTFSPWRLNRSTPSAAATMADNDVDNVEVVAVTAPAAGTYTIQVTNKGVLVDNFQRFSLVLTGLAVGPTVKGACCNGETCSGTVVEGSCAGDWYGGADCGVLTCPVVGACCTGCPPSATCASRTQASCNQSDGRWTSGMTCGQVSCDLLGDVCVTDIQPVVDGDTAFDNRCATDDGPTPVNCDNGSQAFGKDLWFEYVSSCTGALDVSLCDGTDFDAILALYTNGTGQCACPTNSSTQLGLGADDSCGVGGGPPQLTRDVTFGTCYTIRVAGWSGSAGTGIMNIVCTPDQCPIPTAAAGEPDPFAKSRFLSFVPGNPGVNAAIRIKLSSLHHPDPPYSGGPAADFSALEGQVRWVGPPQQYQESTASSDTLLASTLQCAPHYQDWGTVGLLHVTGSAVVPSSKYDVQFVHGTCDPGVEFNYSPALTLQTSRWGDVEVPFNPPDTTAQPDVGDIAAEVSKFQSVAGSPTKARSLLAGSDGFGNIDMATDLSFSQIAACVDAFRGAPYLHTISSCP